MKPIIDFICYDLQNVAVPLIANVSGSVCKRTNFHVLTANYSVDKQTHCALWHERISGTVSSHTGRRFC
jgi:hypothetical protein